MLKPPYDPFKTRVRFLSFFFLFVMAAIFLRLVQLQIFEHAFFVEQSMDQRSRVVTLAVNRGDIVDRNGRLLAVSLDAASVYAMPRRLDDSERRDAARGLVSILGPSAEEAFQGSNRSRSFVWVKRQIPLATADAILKADLPGVGILPESKRVYPRGRIASQMLGFVGVDNQGLSGLELTYDKALQGSAGQVVIERDAHGHTIQSAGVRYIKRPAPGQKLTLTIDESIQYVAERELQAAVLKWKAKGGQLLAMNPQTGEILAMASMPDFDPNRYSQFSPERWKIKPITDMYEPGSTLKTICVAGVLEEKLFTLEDIIPTPETVKLGSRVVGNSHHINKAVWPKHLRDVLAESLNTGMVYIAERLGKDRLYKTLRRFGFGDLTGIDLQGEVSGSVRPPQNWWEADIGMMSFGQAIAVTPLQLVTAYCAIGNGGRLLKPAVVGRLESEDGKLIQAFEIHEKRHGVLSPATLKEMRRALEAVVYQPNGTGHLAKLTYWTTGGKTGTAQKVGPGGGYLKGKYIASEIAMAPMENPQICILVTLDEPQGTIWGAVAAAPVCRKVAEAALLTLGVPASPEEPKRVALRPVL